MEIRKMTQTQHTPGPWIVQGDTYVTANSLIIAHCKQDGYTTLEQGMANARLIAAAPELLEAVNRVLSSHHFSIDFDRNRTPEACDIRSQLIAAISKATGA